MREYRWVPGQGMDPAALARLADHFPCPAEPMGEAWFMGEERRMYSELQGDIAQLPADQVQAALGEIASGYSAFGPMEEWDQWFHYLLPRILPRAHDGTLLASVLESLVTAHVAIYPHGVREAPYESFREDCLLTLGRCLMAPEGWRGRDIVVGRILHRCRNHQGLWGWWNVSGDLAASMAFCLKYLPGNQVLGWLRSVFEIPSPHWRAQIIAWAVGMHDMLEGRISWPAGLDENASPAVTWDWSHTLRGEQPRILTPEPALAETFLPKPSREDALHLLRLYFHEDVFLEWLDSISAVDYLYTELGDIPSRFEQLYVTRRAPRIIVEG